MSATMFDFFINFDEGVLNEIESASTDGKKPVQFFITRTLGSDACGNLALAKAVEDLPSFHKPKVEAETSQRGRKRELSPSKPRKTKAAKVESSDSKVDSKNPPNLVETSGFQRNPDSFIGTMQSLETGEKVYTCQFCGFQGSQRGNVKKHVVVKHIPEAKENFRCQTCGKDFTTKGILKTHYIKVHNMPENMVSAAMKP